MTNSVSIHPVGLPGVGRRTTERGALASALVVALLALMLLMPRAASAQGLFGGGSNNDDQRSAEQSVRINQLEGQLRGLNGQIEQLSFQIRQLQDLVTRLQKDTDFRLQDLEGAASRGAKPPQKKSEAPVEGMPSAMAADGGAAGAAPSRSIAPAPVAPGVARGAAAGNLGQLSGADPIGGLIGSAPMDLGAPSARDAAPVPGVDPRYATVQRAPNARDEYDAAYGYILNGEYDLAETSFRSFLSNHPTDNRVGAAEFWLGETYYARARHREAADAFLKSYTQFPDGPKAPDSLLKLGMALSSLGEKKAACASWDELITKYPKASKAVRDRAAAEKSRGKC